jgi:hypothetical protein
MGAGNAYIATIAIESGDAADILGNNLDDGDGSQLLYSANNDLWYNWTGLTTSMRLRVSSVVGVNEDENLTDLNLYPNPVADELTVSLVANASEEVELTVLDVRGSLVMSEYLQPKQGQLLTQNISLENLPSGMYAVRIQGQTINATRTIIVE